MTTEDDLCPAVEARSTSRPHCTQDHPALALHVDSADRLHRVLHDYDELAGRTDRLAAFRSAVEAFAASYPPTERATHPGAAVIAHLREILEAFG